MSLSTLEQRTSWIEYVADGTIKRFDIPFGYLATAHLVVRDDDTKKTIVTHYTIDEDTKTNGYPEIVFGTAPTNAHVIKIARKTAKGTIFTTNPTLAGLVAKQALYIAEEMADEPVCLDWNIGQTELLAPTPTDLVSPCDGAISRLRTVVQTAVTTGGAITVKVGTTDVDGLSITVADAATKGTTQADTPTAGHASTRVKRGDRIQIVPAAAFATAGAMSGVVEITPDP